ncbi:MAG TPA: hypothetical protein VF884_06440 [Nitrososphaeraceae archaeon]
MDKARLFILVTGLIIIVGFSVFTFIGSSPSSPKSGTKIQPVKKLTLTMPTQKLNSNHEQTTLPISNTTTTKSIETKAMPSFYYVASSVLLAGNSSNSKVPSSQSAGENKSMASLDIYENRDVPENYYSIGFPTGANVVQGANPGSFIATIIPYIYSVELQDIPDDSNVQLYTLTHAEPALKSSLLGYNLVSSGQLGAGKNRAWDLVYTWKNSTQGLETIEVFIEGKDQAAVVTFSSPIQDYAKNNSTINSVLENFKWLGQ